MGVIQTHNIGVDQDIGGIFLGTMVRDTGGQGVDTRAEVVEVITTMQVPLRRPRHRQPMRRHSLRSNPGWLLRREINREVSYSQCRLNRRAALVPLRLVYIARYAIASQNILAVGRALKNATASSRQRVPCYSTCLTLSLRL